MIDTTLSSKHLLRQGIAAFFDAVADLATAQHCFERALKLASDPQTRCTARIYLAVVLKRRCSAELIVATDARENTANRQ